jgi:hypothetical protein
VLGHDPTLTILMVAGLAHVRETVMLGFGLARPPDQDPGLPRSRWRSTWTLPVEQPGPICPMNCPVTPVRWVPLVPRQGNHREQNAW